MLATGFDGLGGMRAAVAKLGQPSFCSQPYADSLKYLGMSSDEYVYQILQSGLLNFYSPCRRTQDASPQTEKPAEASDAHMETTAEPPTAPAAMASANRKRPRLDLNSDMRERKRGKSMFGLVLGKIGRAHV